MTGWMVALGLVAGGVIAGGLTIWLQISPADPVGVMTGSTDAAMAQNASCVDQCQAGHDRCRITTKGSPTCDAERQRCLEQCLIRKRK